MLRARNGTNMLSQSDFAGSSGSGNGGKATTVAINPWSPPLPKKFEELLRAGMKPELIIWDLFRHKQILRNFLESIARDWQSAKLSDVVESSIEYLQSHCVVCGRRTLSVEQGETPQCGECDRSAW